MYTKDKHMPKIRRDVAIYASNHGIRVAARHYGYAPSAVSGWLKKLNKLGNHPILTRSSAPKNSPKQISESLHDAIVDERIRSKRCSEVVHKKLEEDGNMVSLSTVKRVLDKAHLTKKRSPWKRYHAPVERPRVERAGDLVEVDNIHLMTGSKSRIYVTTLIDVYSRVVYAKAYIKINSATSVRFVKEAKRETNIDFNMLQTDHGSEFGRWFVDRSKVAHRYTRLGKPNDNAHIERFNRTIQEEFLDTVKRNVKEINRKLPNYLKHYNEERMHLGINYKRPIQMLK